MHSLLSLLGKAKFSKRKFSEQKNSEDVSQWTASFEHDSPFEAYLSEVESPLFYCANRTQEEFALIDPRKLENLSSINHAYQSDQVLISLRSFEEDKSSLYSAPLQVIVIPISTRKDEAPRFMWTTTLLAADKDFTDFSSFLEKFLKEPDKKSIAEVEAIKNLRSIKKHQEVPVQGVWNTRMEKALSHLKNKEDPLSKIVLSRSISFQSQEDIEPTELFNLMAKNAQGVFKILIKKEDQQFLSFSPESLHELKGNLLKLEAIAGTRPRVSESHPEAETLNNKYMEELLKDPKELEEHQRVIDQLLEKTAGLGKVSLGETGILKLKTLHHLRTPIEVELKKNSHDGGSRSIDNNEGDLSDILTVVDSLHPTPAVCGTPAPLSHKLIGEIEGERGLYAGLLGIFAKSSYRKEQGKDESISHSTVLIRSLSVKGNELVAVGGAGIVKDSLPQNEWLETGNKIDSFMSLLSQDNFLENSQDEKAKDRSLQSQGKSQRKPKEAQVEN